MSEFYISNDDENEVRRCKESRDYKTPIALTGQTSGGRNKAFNGLVQAVQHETKLATGRRWRIILLDEEITD